MGIHRKIEHITGKIKDMVNIIDTPDKPLTASQQQKLGIMILKLQDHELEQTQFSRLQEWIINDRRALRFFVEFAQISESLRGMFTKKQATETPMMANIQ